ncbi:hypothetical protein EG832_02870, partial [bacterium]|nr:hypothetical protein [bacterium]
ALNLPEFDDAFAQTIGEFENVDKLRESIQEQLESRARDEYESTWYEELIDAIVAQAVIKFPPQVVEHEMEHVIEAVQEDLSRQKMELDTYLKTIKKEKATWLEEDIKPVAKKRLERSLVMEEISKLEKIQVKNEDLQEEVSAMIQEMQMQGNVDFKKLEKQLKNERIANNMAMQAASRLVNRKTLDRMKEIATGKAESAAAGVGAPSDADAKPAAKKKAAPKAEKTVEPAAEAAAEPVKAKKPAKKAADTKAD